MERKKKKEKRKPKMHVLIIAEALQNNIVHN